MRGTWCGDVTACSNCAWSLLKHYIFTAAGELWLFQTLSPEYGTIKRVVFYLVCDAAYLHLNVRLALETIGSRAVNIRT